MNANDYVYLLNHPNSINLKHGILLESIVSEFPYFQSAKALQLKNLFSQDSFKYNQALKVTASLTTDRSVLFDFITSEDFSSIQKMFFDEKAAKINAIKVTESEEIKNTFSDIKSITNSEQVFNTSTIDDIADETENYEVTTQLAKSLAIEEVLAIGKPLDFSKDEKHSFQEWLQLSTFNPIERTSKQTAQIILDDKDADKKRKTDLIDKFIETNPKIAPVKNSETIVLVSEKNASDNSYLMTETLAKVYLEQKKYQKAIQAYEILILKYPEKISFFADRISDIKEFQQNNK